MPLDFGGASSSSSYTMAHLLLVGAAAFATGLYLGRLRILSNVASFLGGTVEVESQPTKSLLEIEKMASGDEDFKMVLCVRNDLKMGKGKIAAQCSHASLGLYKKALKRAPKSLLRWEACQHVKVVVKLETEEEMLLLRKNAKDAGVPSHITVDAGRTQIAPNSRTVIAILGPVDIVDKITGHLKLL